MKLKISQKNSRYKIEPGTRVALTDLAQLITHGHDIKVLDERGEDITEAVLRKLCVRVLLEKLNPDAIFTPMSPLELRDWLRENNPKVSSFVTKRYETR